MHQKHFKLEVKSVEDDGTFTGYASVTGNLDSDSEVLDKGAFRRTLDHTKGVVPILWQHDRTQPVGWNTEASEDGYGLAVKGKLMIDTELGRYAQSFLKTGLEVGAKPGLSIGFTVPKGGDYIKAGIRHFKEVALKEYSISTFQSNSSAVVTGAKADKKTKRVAGEDLGSSAFLIVGDEQDTSTWKLPVKFGTEAKTVRHIRNALARINQLKDVSAAEKTRALTELHRLAKEHGIDTSKKYAVGRNWGWLSVNGIQKLEQEKDFNESLLEAQTMNALYQERCTIESALCDATQDVLGDDSTSPDDKKAEIADSLQQHAEVMAAWYARLIDADKDGDTEEDLDQMDGKNEKTGRTISAATAEKIKMAVDHIEKGLAHLKPFAERPYTANDTNMPNPVGGGKAEKVASDSDSDHSLEALLEMVRSVDAQTKAA